MNVGMLLFGKVGSSLSGTCGISESASLRVLRVEKREEEAGTVLTVLQFSVGTLAAEDVGLSLTNGLHLGNLGEISFERG